MVTSNWQASKSAQPPGKLINGLAIAAFLLSLYCCATPALQLLISTNLINLLLAPVLFVFLTHLGFMAWMSIWVIVVWSWLICGIRYWKARHRQGHWIRWWIAPALLWLLSILWVTRIPIAVSFTLHKIAFEQLADRVGAQQKNWVDMERQIGMFRVIGASKLTKGRPPLGEVAIVIEGIGAYQGFIRDPSRHPNKFKASTYSFAPGSNNGDQEIYYLGDGWYVFQNYFD